MSLLARHVVPKSLAAFCHSASAASRFGQTAKFAQLANGIRIANASTFRTPAMSMSNLRKVNIEDEEEILPSKVQKSLNKIIREHKFISHSVESRIVPPDGGSFMATLREVTIKGQTEEGKKEINLFVKTMIPGSDLRIYSVPGVYEKETTMYMDVMKVFNELQEEAEVPVKDRFNSVKAYQGVDSESIIMENMAKRGYTVLERQAVMPLPFAEMAVQQLAKFHAITFVMEMKTPYFFDAKVKSLKQPYRYTSPDWNIFVDNVSRVAMKALDPDARAKVEAYIPTTFEKYSRYTYDPNSVKTMVHNDFRTNNVMVKMDNVKFSKVVLMDYQQTFYGCPVIDFLHFIFSGTDQAFRKQHVEHLKNVYHEEMERFLTYFEVDVENVYPRNEFERLYRERLDYGLMISFWLVPIVLADPGAVPDVTKVDFNDDSFNINDVTKNRVRGVVDDFMQLGYL